MTPQLELAVKRANARGFMNHIITATGATADQAKELYKKSNDKAIRMQKRASLIADSILDDVRSRSGEKSAATGLPKNLQTALSS